MNHMACRAIFLALLAVNTMAVADVQTAMVSGYINYSSGGKQIFLVKLVGGNSGACNTTGRYAIDSSVLHFKGTQAAIMAAYHGQATISINYSTTCNTWINSWDMLYACVGNMPCD
jgi:hypothetical protein